MAQARLGYLALLRANQSFRYLWMAQVVSFLGDWFNTIALYTAVEELGGSTEVVAGVFVAKTLPMFLMTPIAGPLVDRFDRRKILVASDVGRALCAAGLVWAYKAHSPALLIAVLVVMVALSGIFVPARNAVLPVLTNAAELAPANALGGGTWSVMLAIGAALGGLVTAWLGVELALWVDGATFLLSAALLLPLPALLPREHHSDGDAGFAEGVRYLWRRPYLAALSTMKGLMAMAAGAVALIPVFARLALNNGGASGTAMLYTARGLGALVGALFVRRVFGDAPSRMRRLMVAGLLLMGVSYVALGRVNRLPLAMLGYFTAAVGAGLVWVFTGTLAHLATDNDYRGRVFSLEWGGLTLMMSAAAWFAGAAVDRLRWPIEWVMYYSGGLMLLPALLWSVVLLLRLPERDEQRRQQDS